MTYPDDDDVIPLGRGDDDDEDRDLGPDEHDLDLLDGSWEQQYYAGTARKRDWHTVYVGVVLLIVMAMLIPALLVLFQ